MSLVRRDGVVGYVPAGSCDLCRVERGRCTVGAMPPTVNVKLNRESNRESFETSCVSELTCTWSWSWMMIT